MSLTGAVESLGGYGQCDTGHSYLRSLRWYSSLLPMEDDQAEFTWVAGYSVVTSLVGCHTRALWANGAS